MNTTQDYTITLQDNTGRTCVLAINGASIDEMIAAGYEAWQAKEEVEGNAFGNAIARGEIGEDAWMI